MRLLNFLHEKYVTYFLLLDVSIKLYIQLLRVSKLFEHLVGI